MIAIGIDPGLRGAMVALDRTGKLIGHELAKGNWTVGSEYDDARMVRALARLTETSPNFFLFLEEQHSQPGEGHRSVFTTGFGFGLWCGVTAHLVEQRMVVAPLRWQAVSHKGAPGANAKRRSIHVARSRVAGLEDCDDHNLADAACIALYGLHVLGAS